MRRTTRPTSRRASRSPGGCETAALAAQARADLERIAAAGITVACPTGSTPLSMARVAAELGAGTMSLYRYVASKDELLTLMVDTALGPPPSPTIAPPAGGQGYAVGRRACATPTAGTPGR